MDRVQRVAAYAVIVRDDQILLSRLAPRLTKRELWTLPGGGLEHGEDPRDAVVREVHEETGLDVTIGELARTNSLHQPGVRRDGRRTDAHSLRIIYDGWVPPDSPEPRVLEVDGSTVEAAWHPLDRVRDGSLAVVGLVTEALASHRPHPQQRISAYALVVRDGAVLLTRNSELGPHPGQWTLPGGGIDHGESPRSAVAREVAEETGLPCEVGEVLIVEDVHFEGTAPSGRHEDFHGIQLVYSAAVISTDAPRVAEVAGTTDAAAWVPLERLDSDALAVRDLVRHALARQLENARVR